MVILSYFLTNGNYFFIFLLLKTGFNPGIQAKKVNAKNLTKNHKKYKLYPFESISD